MPNLSPVLRRFALAGAALFALSASPASATVCPPGTTPVTDSDVLLAYCVDSGPGDTIFRNFVRGHNPTLYFRMNDPAGSQVMDGDDTRPDGEYKNRQDSGPIGIADDGDTAREFFGDSGYGYINGIDAPNWNGSSPYGSYTMLAWIYMPTPQSGAIMQFGRGGGLFVNGDRKVVFRNGDDWTTPSTTTITANKWFMVAAVKESSSLRLWVQESPSSLTPFNFTPAATGTSLYRPEGQPTFYVGYSEFGTAPGTVGPNYAEAIPWFKGSIDEVVYLKKALTTTQLALLFYADPAPDPSVMNVRKFTTGPAAPGADPVAAPSKRPAAAKPKTPRAKAIAAAKAKVATLTKLKRKVRKQLKQLVKSHAAPKKLAAARKVVAQVTKQLKRANKRLRSLRRF